MKLSEKAGGEGVTATGASDGAFAFPDGEAEGGTAGGTDPEPILFPIAQAIALETEPALHGIPQPQEHGVFRLTAQNVPGQHPDQHQDHGDRGEPLQNEIGDGGVHPKGDEPQQQIQHKQKKECVSTLFSLVVAMLLQRTKH